MIYKEIHTFKYTDTDGELNRNCQINYYSWEFRLDSKNKSYALTDVIGSGGVEYSGKRETWSTNVEVLFPFLENLEISAASRYEHHSDIDETMSSQVAAQMRVSKNVTIRASAGRAEKPQDFADLYRENLITYPRICDRLQSGCASTQYKTIISGNPTLEPENAKSFNIGLQADLSPILVNFNYFQIDRKNIPSAMSANLVNILEAEGNLPSGIVVSRQGGTIEKIEIPITNNAEAKVRGVDLRSRIKRNTDWANLELDLYLSHLMR